MFPFWLLVLVWLQIKFCCESLFHLSSCLHCNICTSAFCVPSRANENVTPQKRIENLFMIDDNVIHAVKFYLKMSLLLICNSHTRFWYLSMQTDSILAWFIQLNFFWSLLKTDPYECSPIFLKCFLIFLHSCHKHWNNIILTTATIWVL